MTSPGQMMIAKPCARRPAAAVAAAASAQGTRWAADSDFEKYRNTITRLYMDEHRVLRDVMHIMEREYDFYAT